MGKYHLCEDCLQDNCDDCYESDCDCNLAEHSVAAALLVTDALTLVKDATVEVPDAPMIVVEDIKADFEPHGGQAYFNVEINGRAYQVSVRPMRQGL